MMFKLSVRLPLCLNALERAQEIEQASRLFDDPVPRIYASTTSEREYKLSYVLEVVFDGKQDMTQEMWNFFAYRPYIIQPLKPYMREPVTGELVAAHHSAVS